MSGRPRGPLEPGGVFGAVPLIADTNVWSNLRRAEPAILEAFRAAARGGLILGSTVVRLEWLHDAKTGQEFDERDRVFAGLARELPITEMVSNAAAGALRDLRAAGADGYHRVGLPDALIAATAQDNGVNVLTQDLGDFEKLAEVLNFTPIRFPVTV